MYFSMHDTPNQNLRYKKAKENNNNENDHEINTPSNPK